MKRSSYLPPEDEFLSYPEPMPATRVTQTSPLIWRGIAYGLVFQTVIVATVVFFAGCAAAAIVAGLAVMGVAL